LTSLKIKIPVSIGELTDKITILEIKSKKIMDPVRLNAVTKELNQLNNILKKVLTVKYSFKNKFNKLRTALLKVNNNLWNIENNIRSHEAGKKFDSEFIELARSVYVQNDRRSAVKNEINKLMGSSFSEVKEYSKY